MPFLISAHVIAAAPVRHNRDTRQRWNVATVLQKRTRRTMTTDEVINEAVFQAVVAKLKDFCATRLAQAP